MGDYMVVELGELIIKRDLRTDEEVVIYDKENEREITVLLSEIDDLTEALKAIKEEEDK